MTARSDPRHSALYAPNRGRDPSAKNASPTRMRGRRSGRLDGCEQSRMGDAFQAPSPAPFEVVTEAAPVSYSLRRPWARPGTRPSRTTSMNDAGKAPLEHRLWLSTAVCCRPRSPPLTPRRSALRRCVDGVDVTTKFPARILGTTRRLRAANCLPVVPGMHCDEGPPAD
jgi:hypothetical protein